MNYVKCFVWRLLNVNERTPKVPVPVGMWQEEAWRIVQNVVDAATKVGKLPTVPTLRGSK